MTAWQWLLIGSALATTTASAAPNPTMRHRTPAKAAHITAPVAEDTASEQIARVRAGSLTPEALLALYAAQIHRHDPNLHAILGLNRQAESEAASASLAAPLYGLPILIKDNIDTRDFLPTTAGSLALAANLAGRDAFVVDRLRSGGAVVLGKTNLSEWANFRSDHASSGWSTVGGLTLNPWDTTRSACGSSAGSAVAVAAGFAGAAIGTETDGSITCPAAMNGIVGLKPTVGLVSRTGIVPISPAQDTAGPMTRDVRDAALLLSVMAESDPADPATHDADRHRTDYTQVLQSNGLRGARIGVLRFASGTDPAVHALFDRTLATLRAQGAILIDIPAFDRKNLDALEMAAMLSEFRDSVNAYLAHTPPRVKTRTLADLVVFNRDHAEREMPWFQQELFERALVAPPRSDAHYLDARNQARQIAGPGGIDALLHRDNLEALIAPTIGPAWSNDLVNGDRPGDGTGAGSLAAIAGYPHLTVPMGQVKGLPIGLSFIGTAWSEGTLLRLGYAFEQARGKWHAPPGF